MLVQAVDYRGKNTRSQLRVLASLIFVLILQACKHPLAIEGEGDIVDLNGRGYGCTLEQFQAGDPACENDVQGDYFVNYEPLPHEGWKFSHWDGSCGHLSEPPNCRFDIPDAWVFYWDAEVKLPIPTLTAVFEEIDPQANDDPLDDGSARFCFNEELLAPGTLVSATYVTASSSGTVQFSYDQMITGGETYNGMFVLKSSTDTVTDTDTPSTSHTDQYFNLGDEADSVNVYGLLVESISEGVMTTTETSFIPFSSSSFNLSIGESFTSSWREDIEVSIFEISSSTSNDVTRTTTYSGRETVAIAGRSYETCKMEISEEVGGVVTTSTNWFDVVNGILVKESSGNTITEILSASVNGREI